MRTPASSALLAAGVALLLPLTSAAAAPVAAAPTAAASAAADQAPGRWEVRARGTGAYQVSWHSPSRFPITSDRPTVVSSGGDSLRIGPPTVSADGRTVSALVGSARRPVPSDFDVMLSGDRLDEPGDDRLVSAGQATAPRSGPVEGRAPEIAVDPGEPGDLETVTSDYTLDPVKLPGMRQPIEMVGHVVEPAPGQLDAAAPLVLFQHGRHSVCYRTESGDGGGGGRWPCRPPFAEIPSQLGYDYVQQLLASQGFVTVSVRVNGINAQDYRLPDGGADARATIIARHLDHWADVAGAHQVDLDEVVLVGHSRGGEGVDRASIQVPLSAPYRIVGQVLIAPTDFGSQTAPYVPTVTLLPSCDGDVSDLQGQRFTDYSRDLLPDDTSLKSSVMVLGANHNFFNTEWTPATAVAPANDDWYGRPHRPCGSEHPGRLSAGEQRDVGAAYIAGAARLFTGEEDFLPLFDGSPVEVPSIGAATVLSHALGGGREVRRPSSDTALTLADGASTSFCQGVAVRGVDLGTCGQRLTSQVTPHWISDYEQTPSHRFLEMSWDAVGQSGGLLLDRPLDLTGDRLELRTLVDPRVGGVDLAVRLTDADGSSRTVTPQGGGRLAALPPALPKIWGQALIVDPADARGVDVSQITAVELVSRSATGRIWVADLAAAPPDLARVPRRRAATVDLAGVRLPEGDGPGTVTARVPFSVQGLTRPGRLVVVASGGDLRGQDRFVVDLAPGQTSGSLPLTYQADDRDDVQSRPTFFTAYATRGLMTDSYLGRAVVVDDDPTPAVSLEASPRTVAEGEPLRFQITLEAPVDYDLYGSGRVVEGTADELHADDLTAAARSSLGISGDDLTNPLSDYDVRLDGPGVPAGRVRAVVEVPTRDDRRAEGRESMTVRFAVPTADGVRRFTRTGYLAASDGG